MAMQDLDPLDEIQYRREEIVRWWVDDYGGTYMSEHFIHHYFSESEFFDWNTKNGILMDQAKRIIETQYLVHDRKAFEAQLKARSGVEYLIVDEPQPVTDKALAAQSMTTGIWVIRKQDRQPAPRPPRVRPPSVLLERDENGREWELTILATYYIVGESIYQAPSVYDIISNRVLASAAKLSDFFNVANDLPRYDPAIGHHYLAPRVTKPTTSSVSGTPNGSREGSIAPGEDLQSLRSGSVNVEAQNTGARDDGKARDTKLLIESLERVFRYGDEFVDENPLTGEPGNLRFTTSMAAVKKRRADEELAAAKLKAEQESATTSRFATPKPEKGPTPPSVFTTEVKSGAKGDKSGKDERKSSKADKKRRKSRHGGTATSPTTPISATTPQAFGPVG